MIDGYIEVVTGVGKNSKSVTIPFTGQDPATVTTWVPQLSGATLGNPQALTLNGRDVPIERCAGIWTGTNDEGKQASIRVWISEPE